MEKGSVITGPAPEVSVEQVHGDLLVKGWEKPEVRARGESGNGLTLDKQEDIIRLNCQGDCSLRVPVGAQLKVGNVHGEARFRTLEDQLSIEQIHGTLTLKDVAEVQVESVQGNLLAKQISGDLHIEQVQGNAIIRGVEGDLSIDQVHGNLDLRSVEGTINASVNGNARLRLTSLTEGSYQIEAEGNIYCRIKEDAGVAVRLTSGGHFIELRTPDQEGSFQQGEYSFTLGEGERETELNLSAGGRIFFGTRDTDWAEMEDLGAEFDEEFIGMSEDFDQQIAEQVEEQIEAQMEAMNEQMSRLSEIFGKSGLSEAEAERAMRRARESTERATARAQEKIARAQEKMQEKIARKMEAAARKAELKARAAERRGQAHRGSAWNFQWPPAPPAPPAPAREQSEPVSDEERLMILRMLEQKKITLEEAEKLLAALEGKEGKDE